MKCKLTDKEIKPFMSFGKMPLANGFLDKDEFKSEYFFKMEVGFSEDLSLYLLVYISLLMFLNIFRVNFISW